MGRMTFPNLVMAARPHSKLKGPSKTWPLLYLRGALLSVFVTFEGQRYSPLFGDRIYLFLGDFVY